MQTKILIVAAVLGLAAVTDAQGGGGPTGPLTCPTITCVDDGGDCLSTETTAGAPIAIKYCKNYPQKVTSNGRVIGCTCSAKPWYDVSNKPASRTGTAKAGETCTSDDSCVWEESDEILRCGTVRGLTADGTERKCMARNERMIGDACKFNWQCSTYVCTSGRCAGGQVAGGKCPNWKANTNTGYVNCGPGLKCLEGLCVAPYAPGATCEIAKKELCPFGTCDPTTLKCVNYGTKPVGTDITSYGGTNGGGSYLCSSLSSGADNKCVASDFTKFGSACTTFEGCRSTFPGAECGCGLASSETGRCLFAGKGGGAIFMMDYFGVATVTTYSTKQATLGAKCEDVETNLRFNEKTGEIYSCSYIEDKAYVIAMHNGQRSGTTSNYKGAPAATKCGLDLRIMIVNGTQNSYDGRPQRAPAEMFYPGALPANVEKNLAPIFSAASAATASALVVVAAAVGALCAF